MISLDLVAALDALGWVGVATLVCIVVGAYGYWLSAPPSRRSPLRLWYHGYLAPGTRAGLRLWERACADSFKASQSRRKK